MNLKSINKYLLFKNKQTKIIFIIIILLMYLLKLYYFDCNKKENFIDKNNIEIKNNNIDQIYVINLEKNKDRLNFFMDNANKAKLNVKRFNAINGKEISKNSNIYKKYFKEESNLTPGQIGCALSHVKIWQDTIKNNYKNIIVFEDDAIIPLDFWNKFNNFYNNLPDNFDMLLISCCTCMGTYYNNSLVKAGSDGNWCSSGYVITNNYCKKILDRIKNKKIDDAIDSYIKTNYKNDNIFIPIPPFILQNKNFESDIIMGDLGNTLHFTF